MFSYPTVIYTGSDPRTSDSVRVVSEGLSIDVLDVTSAVSLQMSMYWAFNFKYAPWMRNTLALLEHVMGVKYTPLKGLSLRAATALSA